MIQITLPDQSVRTFESPLTVEAVAQSIGPGLAKAAIAARINGKLSDLSALISESCDLSIVTAKDNDGLEVIRHSTAHLLAYAVKDLHPTAQVTIGPVIENGFYYDFSYHRPFTPEDLQLIEDRMRLLAQKDEKVIRQVLPRDQAVEFFKKQGELYKAEIIESIPAGEDVSLYSEGAFTDLCRGPHVPSTGRLGHFKLMKVAGAYWRGDHRNEMLQRIYGTAWANKEDLKNHLTLLEEAEKRDHRKLGRELDLFHIDEHSPGTVFWHPKGWVVWQEVEQYMRRVYRDNGYFEVKGPQILDQGLWEKTGHWDKYRENMFVTESEKRDYALKPMNCPGHILIYKQGVKSYRDLPLRYGEFGQCHRNEPTGGLHGIMRVRAFTQDDGHIFCTEAQIQSEVTAFTSLLQRVYADFGFHQIIYKLSTRPEKRIGTEESWDRAEAALAAGLKASGCEFEYLPGEGAFYGPKIEYTLKDALGREWQCGTIQVDPNLPERLDAEYVGEDGARHRPVMLHRAIVGSLERFIGILLEQHAGALPVWLAPVQVVVLNITDSQREYALDVANMLKNQGLRVESDLRNEKITYKIREHAVQKLPFILVVGDKEMSQGAVSVRARGNQDLGIMPVQDCIERICAQVASRK
ncbi:MAG: threonine--tRNA ligase [Betaproteobacteria bacterium]|nr:threonine--tRNA ligase [Betaproteobacteria bacterium]